MRFILIFSVLTLVCSCQRSDKLQQRETSSTSHDTTLPSDPTDTIWPPANSQSELTPDESSWKTYHNDRLQFEFKYPADLTVRPKFSTYDILPKTWRAMATFEEPGQPVVAVPIVHLSGRTAYPRFYDVEFRIGVSDSLANCRATNGERTLGPIVISGSTFNQFEFSDAAMMKYVSGISYRTGHNGRCYAIEQIRSGSNYRDSAKAADLSQKQLDAYYYLAGKIVRTFRFLDAK